MSSALTQLVPVLDGTNYREWKPLAIAYLQFAGVWDVVDGTNPEPSDLPPDAKEEDKEARRKEQRAWLEKNMTAKGALTLRMTPAIRLTIQSNQLAQTIWTKLEESYGTPGASVVFADFRKAIAFKLSENENPVPQMDDLRSVFDRLHANGVRMPDFFQAMILINAIPQKWDSIAVLLMQNKKVKELKLADVREAIMAEYERRTQGSVHANKMSAIKRKKGNPNFKQQKQQQSSSNSPAQGQQGQSSNDKKKSKRGKSSGKKKQHHHHHHTHMVDADSDSDSDDSSQIASAVVLGSHIISAHHHTPTPTTTSVASFTSSTRLSRSNPYPLYQRICK